MNLGNILDVEEVSEALKSMKNNKTPGIDGIPADFLKVFWRRLKFFVTNAINSCYKKGILSTTLRQSVITCLPKGKKERKLLKNWRPISLLCTTYKLASSVIANRLKPHLDSIISNTQTGFLKGRSISESTRLIYDLLYCSEKYNIPGLLMAIDFDSTSWSFLYDALQLFGFDNSLIDWIKMFNRSITARVQQCGFLSEPIIIERGCRQGGPIASYLFLIAAEVLSIIIKMTPDIVGIKIGKTEFKMVQYADDTTIILDGSRDSLQATLNVLEIYGSLSGLRVNTEKTKIIWIGKKKHSNDKLLISAKLDWGSSEFNLLGIDFSVDLERIPQMNYTKALDKARKTMKNSLKIYPPFFIYSNSS